MMLSDIREPLATQAIVIAFLVLAVVILHFTTKPFFAGAAAEVRRVAKMLPT